MYLQELNAEEAEKEFEFLSKIENENGFINPFKGMSYSIFANCELVKRIDEAHAINLADGRVPQTLFLLSNGQEYVGFFKLRHYLNDTLKDNGGHIAYFIVKEHRNKGYATEGLKLLIEYIKTMENFNDEELFLECYKNNEPSYKVMLSNGGYLHHETEEEYFVRIKVR